MTRKKTVKQLMAVGIQRNEAAAFARTYRKIKAAKREDMFPEIVYPVQPKICTVANYQVIPFRASHFATAGEMMFFAENGEEYERLVKRRLCDKLTDALMGNGAIAFTMTALRGGNTEFRAELKVDLRY